MGLYRGSNTPSRTTLCAASTPLAGSFGSLLAAGWSGLVRNGHRRDKKLFLGASLGSSGCGGWREMRSSGSAGLNGRGGGGCPLALLDAVCCILCHGDAALLGAGLNCPALVKLDGLNAALMLHDSYTGIEMKMRSFDVAERVAAVHICPFPKPGRPLFDTFQPLYSSVHQQNTNPPRREPAAEPWRFELLRPELISRLLQGTYLPTITSLCSVWIPAVYKPLNPIALWLCLATLS